VQSVQECSDPRHGFRIIRGQVHEHADPPHPLALLRMRRDRPRRRSAADEPDELAPSHELSSKKADNLD
jgi:hypothetical protein